MSDNTTTSASEFEEIVSELEAEHCSNDVEIHVAQPYEKTSVLELERIQKGKHEAIFKGTGAITSVGILLGDDYKNFDIGVPHVVTVGIVPQQMTTDEAPVNEPETEQIPLDFDDEPIPEPDGPLVED